MSSQRRFGGEFRSDPSPLDLPVPRPAHRGMLLALSLAALALQIAVIGRYGYFRDELYYLARPHHLEWGYVDHPSLSIAVLAAIRRVFGDSLLAIRLLPALICAGTVFLTGALAARLGGGRFAQALGAAAALVAPVFLGICHIYSMNAIDLLLWTAAISPPLP